MNIQQFWESVLAQDEQKIRTYTFMPDELKGILERLGVWDIKLADPGAYARTIPNELLVKIMNDPKQRSDFLDVCYRFDSNPFVCGMGKENLLAKGEIPDELS